MSKPFISFIIPTYNALPDLRNCLESIFKQDYPAERFEVLVVDGGSTDGTREAAREFKAQVLDNPQRVAEHGKSIGIQNARGKIIALLDADNVIATSDWLKKMIQPLLKNPQIFGVESSYLQHPNYSLLNRYLIALHIADPFARTLAKLTGISPIGANGFLWRKKIIDQFHNYKNPFLEADLSAHITQTTNYHHTRVAQTGIYHFHLSSWTDFLRKRYKIAREFLNRSPTQGQTWAYRSSTRLSFLLAIAYCASFFGPFIEGVFNALKNRQPAWLLHPFACLTTVAVYGLTLTRHLVFPFSIPGQTPTHFILSHHSPIQGAIDHCEYFLRQQNKAVVRVSRPLRMSPNQHSSRYETGKTVRAWPRRGKLIRNLPYDFYLSLRQISCTNIQTFIGADNFDTLVGLTARFLHLQDIPKIIYFSSGFAYQRFDNPVLNRLYLLIERLTLHHADQTISKTQRAARERVKLGLDPSKSLVIPNGVQLKNPRFKPKKINPRHFIYVGQLNPEHGLISFIKVMKGWIKELVVIGDGPDWQKLKAVVAKTDYKSKLYHQRDHDFVISKLQDFTGFGLAPYSLESKLNSHTYYGSPLKVKKYISCGLPVVLSEVPEISQQIQTQNLGIAYRELKSDKIISRIKRFNSSKFHIKAKNFYNKNQWKKLLKPLTK